MPLVDSSKFVFQVVFVSSTLSYVACSEELKDGQINLGNAKYFQNIYMIYEI